MYDDIFFTYLKDWPFSWIIPTNQHIHKPRWRIQKGPGSIPVGILEVQIGFWWQSFWWDFKPMSSVSMHYNESVKQLDALKKGSSVFGYHFCLFRLISYELVQSRKVKWISLTM